MTQKQTLAERLREFPLKSQPTDTRADLMLEAADALDLAEKAMSEAKKTIVACAPADWRTIEMLTKALTAIRGKDNG